jgi:hypothetical protein
MQFKLIARYTGKKYISSFEDAFMFFSQQSSKIKQEELDLEKCADALSLLMYSLHLSKQAIKPNLKNSSVSYFKKHITFYSNMGGYEVVRMIPGDGVLMSRERDGICKRLR